ncbi:hypothetical protein PR202_gb07710 [Eleusine coracana subsp. coracana]|uniref:Uncharacterized protein n=1 Tax=Eleusine coracana subsp. coracana TaxID=191504 RepID=A0AAV5EDR7_ELECO|nr:hypothetical protein PR202_gb07710 [Eleusine coracana subsp. coracana]
MDALIPSLVSSLPSSVPHFLPLSLKLAPSYHGSQAQCRVARPPWHLPARAKPTHLVAWTSYLFVQTKSLPVTFKHRESTVFPEVSATIGTSIPAPTRPPPRFLPTAISPISVHRFDTARLGVSQPFVGNAACAAVGRPAPPVPALPGRAAPPVSLPIQLVVPSRRRRPPVQPEEDRALPTPTPAAAAAPPPGAEAASVLQRRLSCRELSWPSRCCLETAARSLVVSMSFHIPSHRELPPIELSSSTTAE